MALTRLFSCGVLLLGDLVCYGEEPTAGKSASPAPKVKKSSSKLIPKSKPAEATTDQPKTKSTKPKPATEDSVDSTKTTASKVSGLMEFFPLAMPEPVTSFALTEDRRFLVVSHQAANQVTIWDVVTNELVKTLETPLPRNVLCRGDGIYVVNSGKGLISFFSATKQWELTNQFEVDKPNIVHLSAAQGKAFNGQLLVTTHAPGAEGSYHGPQVFLVNTKKEQQTPIAEAALASVSHDGKLVFTQGSFNLSPSGGISAFAFADLLRKNAQPIFRGGIQQTPYVFQVHPGSYWIGSHMIFAGAPIQLLQQDLGNILVPDLSNRVIYALTKERLRALRLDTSLAEIGSRKIAWPKPQAEKFEGIYHTIYRHRGYLLDYPVAVTTKVSSAATTNDELRLFVLDMNSNVLLTAITPAFSTADSETNKPSPSVIPGAASPRPADAGGAAEQSELGLPARIVEDKPLRIQIKGKKGAEYELMTGPAGMTLTKAGLLTWMPTKDHRGTHALKIRVKAGKDVSFARPAIEVLGKDVVGSGGSLDTVDRFDRLELDVDHFELTSGRDYRSLLLLQGNRLRVLGPDGFNVAQELELPQRYRQIAEREDCFVALSKQPPQLDLIDKETRQVRKSIPIQRAGVRVLDVLDVALHPQQPIAYVAIKHDIELPRHRMLIVDETSGSVEAPEGLIATWIKVDPAGRYLYAGYEDLYERGARFHINPGGQILETPEYGNIDWLITYELRGKLPKFSQVERKAGGNGNGIRLSADGQRITYLSHVGTPMHSKNLVAWNPTKLKDQPVNYETKDRAITTLLAFHPTLKIVAVPGGDSAILFDRETGKLLENRLQMTAKGLGGVKVEDLIFSPDGKSLLFVCNDSAQGRYIRRVGLRLSDAEVATAGKSISIPAASTNAGKIRRAIDAAEFDALKTMSLPVGLTAKEIGRRYMDAVVLVKSDKGIGTGFVIGRHGYVLTCAHVLPVDGEVSVIHSVAGTQDKTITSAAEVLLLDDDRDLALLKLSPKADMTTVVLAKDDAVESGEEATVIGNPGLGSSEILTRTLTTGVVSSPRRDFEGQKYIQTSAAVNPGNSGGPMFDSHGQVIGLVILKARIDATAFAVPATSLREFLKQATK